MGLVDDVLAERGRQRVVDQRYGYERAWPVGKGSVPYDGPWGHDASLFAPENYADALATSNDIYSVVSRRARLMQTPRLRFYRGRDNDKKLVDAHPAVDLYWYVNEFWSSERLTRMDELSMGVWGESYWALEYGPDGNGSPSEIWWLKASRTRPVLDEHNYVAEFVYEPQYGGPLLHFAPNEIVWFRYPNPIDEFAPLSPLAAAKLAAETSQAMMVANLNMHRQGLSLAGLVVPTTDKVTFSQEQAEELEKKLLKRFSGADAAHRWAVLRYEAQFKQLSVTPKDAEFIQGLGLTWQQVCRAYGMAASMDEPGGSRAEWEGTLVPDANFRAAELREQYLPRFTGKGVPDNCEYDYSSVSALQEAQSEAWGIEAQMLDRGAITLNEWRRKYGYPDVDWGDAPWLPMNKGQYIDGKLVIPGQDQPGMPGPLGQPALPGGAEMGGAGPGAPQPTQGGPVPTGPDRVPLPALRDDERNPSNLPAQSKGELVHRGFDHMTARRLIADAFTGYQHHNGYQRDKAVD